MIIGCQSVGSWHPWYSVAAVQIRGIDSGNKLLKQFVTETDYVKLFSHKIGELFCCCSETLS